MADQPTNPILQVTSQLATLWQRQPRGRRLLAIGVVLAIGGFVLWTTVLHRPSPPVVVSESASPDDTEEMAATLRARGLSVEIVGGKVLVPADQVEQARAAAAAAGLPRMGKGFELFDGSSFGKSSFTEQINYRRALEGELARSISALAPIESARVHLALGHRSVFKDHEEPPSASIAIRLHAGQTLTTEQVRGIHQLVAASVDGLKAEAVSVVDNHGNLLDPPDTGARDRKAEIERETMLRVRTMLERVVGAGHVSVVATADVDDRQMSETEEVYDHEHPAIRSESRTLDNVDPATTIGGVAGTRGNLPGAPAASPGAGVGSGGRLQETKNYEISRTVRQTTKPDVQIQRLHVAIVVDYRAEGGKQVARSSAELDQLAALARQAAAIDDTRGDKIELRSMPFVPDTDVDAAAPVAASVGLPIIPVAAGGGGVLVLVVLAALLLRKRPRAITAPTPLALPAPLSELERVLVQPSAAAAALAAAPATPALPEGKSVRERVLDAVRADVDRTAGVLSSWLATTPPAPAPAKQVTKEGKA